MILKYLDNNTATVNNVYTNTKWHRTELLHNYHYFVIVCIFWLSGQQLSVGENTVSPWWYCIMYLNLWPGEHWTRNHYFFHTITHSQGSASVVRAMGKGKLWPPPPPNPLTDRHQKLHRWLRHRHLPYCQISSRSDKWFRFYARAISRIKLFTRLFVCFYLGWGFFRSSTPKTSARIFDTKYVKRWVPRKDVPFGVRVCKTKNWPLDPFTSKTAIFGPVFGGTEIFDQSGFNIGNGHL